MERVKTKFIGVYSRKSSTKKHKGRADICFDITYTFDSRKRWEKIGWVSEGYSAKLASQVRAERVRAIRHGEDLPKEKKKAPYFKEVAERYLEWCEQNKTRQGRDEKSRYRNHLGPVFGSMRLDQISAFDLERLKSSLTKKGLSPATVKHILVQFREIVNKAIAWGLYPGPNPIRGVKMPVIQNQRQRFLSYEEADLLLTELSKVSKQIHDIALLSLHTGLRAGEIFNLKGQDLNFENDLIVILDPKNKRTRHAYMTDAVREMLQARIPDQPEDFVFLSRDGKKIISVSKSFRKIVSGMGFNEGITDRRQMVTFHSLRHSHASWLVLQGESLITVRDALGHADLSMVSRYSHLAPDQQRRAVLALETAFKKANGALEIIK